MATASTENIPDVALSETAHLSAMLGFGLLALALFAGLAFANWLRKKREKDGIYRKYALPGDRRRVRR